MRDRYQRFVRLVAAQLIIGLSVTAIIMLLAKWSGGPGDGYAKPLIMGATAAALYLVVFGRQPKRTYPPAADDLHT